MENDNHTNNVIILFDEQGTPTFRVDREMKYFLGVAVAYDILHEKTYFDLCSKSFGLSKNKPLKNNKISKGKAIEIARLISMLDLEMNVAFIDLSNNDLQKTTLLYEEFCNAFRERFREGVRDRPVSQILHSFLHNHVLLI